MTDTLAQEIEALEGALNAEEATREFLEDLLARLKAVAAQRPRLADAAGAEAQGFAAFNAAPHLLVEVPDGSFTISAKTSAGETVTFCFLPYRTGGPAGCVDIQRHKGPRHPERADLPTFDAIGFGPGTGDVFDTRKAAKRMTLATVLLENRKGE